MDNFVLISWSFNEVWDCLFAMEYAKLLLAGLIIKKRLILTYPVNTVCSFWSMKSPVELNCLLLNFFCYITWFD